MGKIQKKVISVMLSAAMISGAMPYGSVMAGETLPSETMQTEAQTAAQSETAAAPQAVSGPQETQPQTQEQTQTQEQPQAQAGAGAVFEPQASLPGEETVTEQPVQSETQAQSQAVSETPDNTIQIETEKTEPFLSYNFDDVRVRIDRPDGLPFKAGEAFSVLTVSDMFSGDKDKINSHYSNVMDISAENYLKKENAPFEDEDKENFKNAMKYFMQLIPNFTGEKGAENLKYTITYEDAADYKLLKEKKETPVIFTYDNTYKVGIIDGEKLTLNFKDDGQTFDLSFTDISSDTFAVAYVKSDFLSSIGEDVKVETENITEKNTEKETVAETETEAETEAEPQSEADTEQSQKAETEKAEGPETETEEKKETEKEAKGEEKKEKELSVSALGMKDNATVSLAKITDENEIEKIKEILGSGTTIVSPLDITTDGELTSEEDGAEITLSGMDIENTNEVLYHIKGFDTDSPEVETLEYTYDKESHTVRFTTHSFSPFVFAIRQPERRLPVMRAPAKTLDEFTASISDGASAIKNASGGTDYVWDVPIDSTDKGHGFIYRITFSLSGESFYQPGQVQMTVPKKMLKDRNGNYADEYSLSVPEEGSNTGEFVYKEDGDNIVIYNRTTISAADNGYIEIMYSTTKDTYEYADYGKATSSDTFKATIKAGDKTQTVSAPPVSINTKAYVVASETKYYPQRYESWQPSWGAAPSDAANYFYLVWEVRTIIQANGKYDFTLSDDFAKYGKVIGFKMQGMNSFAHAGALTSIGASGTDNTTYTIKDQTDTYEYGRYDYELTALSKADYDNLLKTQLIGGLSGSYDSTTDSAYGYYEVINNSTSKVQHVDKVDAESTADATKKYRYEEPHFTYPAGHFWSDKWGYDYYDRYVYSSEYIRLYGDVVKPFKKGATNKLSSFKYRAYAEGYPYPWTIEDGASAKDGNNYGKKAVTYTMDDSKLVLGDTELKDADYDITQLDLSLSFSEVKYNQTTYAFDSTAVNNANDVIDVYVKKTLAGDFTKAASYRVSLGTFTIADSGIVESVNGKTIKFKPGVKGFRLVTANAHYYTYMGADAYVSLNRTDTVIDYINKNTDLISLYNTNAANIKDYKNNQIVSFSHVAANYATAATTKSNIKKRVKAYKNDPVNKAVNITWTASVYEKTATTDKYVAQGNGTFYDILPLGADYKNNSVVVKADNKVISDSDMEVRTVSNYKNSGRTLIVVNIKVPANVYDIEYVSTYPWDSVHDFGKSVRNTIAYETGNADIGDGSPDDGGSLTYDKEIMTGLDPANAGKERFIYAQRSVSLSVPTSALLGLYKKVKASKDSAYVQETSVKQNEEYTYKIRFATDANTEAKDLILFDSLENFKTTDGKTSDWRGTLSGIDLSQVRALGIDPVVYYSTSSALRTVVPKTESSGSGKDYAWGDLEYTNGGTKVWTTQKPKNVSDITGIAIDLRTTVSGRKYTLPKNSAVTVILLMKSPAVVSGNKEDPIAYNNIYLYSTVKQTSEKAGGGQSITENTELNHQDYTIVHHRVLGDINILKVSEKDNSPIEGITFTLKGKSAYGTNVSMTEKTGTTGTISFKDIERGTYTLQETKGIPDFLEDHSIINIKIDGDGTAKLIEKADNGTEKVITETGNVKQDAKTMRLTITNKPRVHGDFSFMKRDSVSGHVITGANFKLSGTSDYGNDILMYASSNNGTVSFKNVEKGKYTLKETSAADGYILPLVNAWEVVCNESGLISIASMKQTQNGDYVITNEPYHKLSILKISAYDGSQLKGAKFKLTGTSDYGTAVDATATSDGSGFATFEHLEPGTYVLEETGAPTATVVVNADKTTSEDTSIQYRLDTTKRAARVNADGTTEIEGLKDDGSGNIMYPNQRIPTDTVVITKKWNDGLTGKDAENRPYPNIHIESYDPNAEAPTPTPTMGHS